MQLPVGAFLKRKTFHYSDPRYGQVVKESDGSHIIIAWEQESHPMYWEVDDAYRNRPLWIPETVPAGGKPLWLLGADHGDLWRPSRRHRQTGS